MKRIRLDQPAYGLGHCFSVTISTAGRTKLFQRNEIAKVAIEALVEAADKYAGNVYAYCLMPDHVHILVSTPNGADLIQFVRQFKQLSAYRIRRLAGCRDVWQPRFYDHGLRSEEELLGAARYILHNPVRAGLASEAHEYPYSGSLVWEGMNRSGSKDARPTSNEGGVKTPDLHSYDPRQRVWPRVTSAATRR